MNFIVHIGIFCFAINFQLITSNVTIDVTQDTETTKQIHHDQPEQTESTQLITEFSESTTEAPEPTTEASEPTTEISEPIDQYTFVVIIEIMFNDGSRKNCTGTIIHDNVVITAAHCFEKEFIDSVEPELAGSFVIIGTKDMFDTGYEKYLPIEQVLIHPDNKGWNADLALIYTYAGMMSDKPGDIIPLAVEDSFTPLYGNVTVLQWNQTKQKKNTSQIDVECASEDEEIFFEKEVTRPILTSGDLSKEVNKESTLIMDEYTIFNTDSCIKLVKKLRPKFYHIERVNKTICFYTKHLNKVQVNSGAPVVHRNHLVAIASGDINHDSEHIIVATKLNCYCRWIRANLPSGGEKLKCCSNCCSESRVESKREIYF